jgi:hypothetical protein
MTQPRTLGRAQITQIFARVNERFEGDPVGAKAAELNRIVRGRVLAYARAGNAGSRPLPHSRRSRRRHQAGSAVARGEDLGQDSNRRRAYTPGRRRRESGGLFALTARLAAQAANNNITMQATVVTVAASSVSAWITSRSLGGAPV